MARDPQKYYTEMAEKYARQQSFEEMPEEAEKAVKQLLKRFHELVGSGRVLDAGCGAGRDTEYLAEKGLDAVGIDFAPGMVEEARESGGRAKYAQMDVRDFGFDSGTFDGVLCSTVMQFIPHNEMDKAVSELGRVLKSGGVLYITFKLSSNGRNSYTRESDGMERYTLGSQQVEKLLNSHGFELIDSTSFSTNDRDDVETLGVFCRKS